MKYSMDPRFHKELNFRDLGGYPSRDGRTIRHGIFYRSGGLCFMNEEELATFKHLGIRCVIDFRTQYENERHPDPDLPGIDVYRCSGVVSKGGEGIDFSPKGMNQIGEAGERQLEVLTTYYKEMPFHNEAFQTMVKQIVAGNVPICIHCATGKDRTGVGAMIILFLLGVEEETVLQDYLLSCTYRQDVIERVLREKAAQIEAHPVLKELLWMKEGVTEKIGRTILQTIKERYGSDENYLIQEFGLTAQDLQDLRDTYLE
jgi:Protein tyrosine/serine phosphatase